MTGSGESTSAVDLSITFFASVLVLFVFIEFNLQPDPTEDARETLQQREATIDVAPAGWSAINRRGSYALFSENTLHVLDLEAFAIGALSPIDQISSDKGYFAFRLLDEAAPHAYELRITLDRLAPDIALVRSSHSVNAANVCPTNITNAFLTVLMPSDEPDFTPLLQFLRQCGLQARLEFARVSSDGARISFGLARSASQYTTDRIFR